MRDAVPTPGTATYYLTVTSKIDQGSTSATVEVKPKVGSGLTLGATAALVAGQSGTLTGQLTYTDGTPAAGASVVLGRQSGDSLVESQTVTTGADGSYSVTTTAPAAGTATYTARCAGDTGHAAAARDLLTAVALNPTTLTLSGTVDRRKVATVVATLGPTLVDANRIVRITAQTNGGTPVLVAEGRVDANGQLVATYTTTVKTTTFTATFTGDGYNERQTTTIDVRR